MAYDTITPQKLCRAAISTTPAVDTQYTVPALTRTIVKNIDIANTTAAAINVTVYIVESGGSPSAANELIPGALIPANGIFQWAGAQVMLTGETIRTTASAAGTTIHASGGECI